MTDLDAAWLGLAAATERYADRAAVIDNEGQYTYAELTGRIRSAMRVLSERGLGAGRAILIVTPNTRESVAAYLAALHLGATVVLLDRRAGRADVKNAVDVAGVEIVIGDSEFEASTPAGLTFLPLADLVDAVDLVDLVDAVAGAETPVGAELFVPPSAAVIMFTSGTSSRPKAVRHTVASLRAGVRNMAYTLSFTADDAPFLVSPLASITGVSQMHLALERGGRLLLEDSFNTDSSLDRLIDLAATVFGGAPFVLEELLSAAIRRDCESLPIRAIAIGGAAVPPELMDLAESRYGIVPSRVYGSSECPIAFASAPSDDRRSRLENDGIAMPGTQARIDPANDELHVRGENLFAGYLDPAHNDESFTADGWFRTGDRATLDGGRLRITGRLKEVVARKGLKISMAEVDALLRGLPASLDAATYGLPDEETGERLAVAVQTERPADITLESVTTWLLEAGLAKWKLPEEIAVWQEPLPYTASGKVLRRSLAEGGIEKPKHHATRLRRQNKDD